MSETNELWTIGQLADRVADALADNYAGQRSGRVSDVPNNRTIRWYTTIGLVDRPSAMRGRTALYGRRHLLQLVAVKRMQAAGRPLAEIQAELLGAPDLTLGRLANLPAGSNTEPITGATPAPAGFWRAQPATQQADTGAGSAKDPDTVTKSVFGVRIDDSVTVLLNDAARQPDAADVTAIEAAAGPLLALLRELGLTGASAPAREQPDQPSRTGNEDR